MHRRERRHVPGRALQRDADRVLRDGSIDRGDARQPRLHDIAPADRDPRRQRRAPYQRPGGNGQRIRRRRQHPCLGRPRAPGDDAQHPLGVSVGQLEELRRGGPDRPERRQRGLHRFHDGTLQRRGSRPGRVGRAEAADTRRHASVPTGDDRAGSAPCRPSPQASVRRGRVLLRRRNAEQLLHRPAVPVLLAGGAGHAARRRDQALRAGGGGERPTAFEGSMPRSLPRRSIRVPSPRARRIACAPRPELCSGTRGHASRPETSSTARSGPRTATCATL
jgi:hypothetical protein